MEYEGAKLLVPLRRFGLAVAGRVVRGPSKAFEGQKSPAASNGATVGQVLTRKEVVHV